MGDQNFSLKNSMIFNNTYAGLLEEECNNSSVTHNNFTQNGLSEENEGFGSGAIFQIETNSTVTDNVFKGNYDSLLIGEFSEDIASTQIYNYNTFDNNSYTFDFSYDLFKQQYKPPNLLLQQLRQRYSLR